MNDFIGVTQYEKGLTGSYVWKWNFTEILPGRVLRKPVNNTMPINTLILTS